MLEGSNQMPYSIHEVRVTDAESTWSIWWESDGALDVYVTGSYDNRPQVIEALDWFQQNHPDGPDSYFRSTQSN